MIEAIRMISHLQMLFEIAAIGSLGYVLGFISRLAHQWMKYRHQQKTLKIKLEYGRAHIADTQEARGLRFPVARAIITFSVFVLFSLFVFINNMTGHATAIPVEHTTSLFWGLYQKTAYGVQQIKAYYYDPMVFYEQSSMVIGFYFGQKID